MEILTDLKICFEEVNDAINMLDEMDKKQAEAIEILMKLRDRIWYLERAVKRGE